jgi:phosphoribosylpyrophosphate synthetase
MTGKTGNPTENMEFNSNRFAGKKVILVDDVRTRGVTFDRTADKLESLGAVSVYGVFLAQTIHPNLPVDTTPRYRGGYYDEIINDYLAEEYYEDELANAIMEEELYQQQMEEEFMYEMAGEYY